MAYGRPKSLVASKEEEAIWLHLQCIPIRQIAEPMFLDPDDAMPECWNLWRPCGLTRLIDARAKAVGIGPSQLVQRWHWQVLDAEEGRRDA